MPAAARRWSAPPRVAAGPSRHAPGNAHAMGTRCTCRVEYIQFTHSSEWHAAVHMPQCTCTSAHAAPAGLSTASMPPPPPRRAARWRSAACARACRVCTRNACRFRCRCMACAYVTCAEHAHQRNSSTCASRLPHLLPSDLPLTHNDPVYLLTCLPAYLPADLPTYLLMLYSPAPQQR